MNKIYKFIYTGFICIILGGGVIGCSNEISNNASPEFILKSNPNADFFIMDETVYISAENIDWIKEVEFKEGKLLGKINKSEVKRDFEDFNATILSANTEIYELDGRKDIVLVKVNGQYMPYLKYVEG